MLPRTPLLAPPSGIPRRLLPWGRTALESHGGSSNSAGAPSPSGARPGRPAADSSQRGCRLHQQETESHPLCREKQQHTENPLLNPDTHHPSLKSGSSITSLLQFVLCTKCMLSHLSRVQLFVTLWIAALQAPLSMGFSRQQY